MALDRLLVVALVGHAGIAFAGPPPDARDPDAYSDPQAGGRHGPAMAGMDMDGDASSGVGRVLVDRLETVRGGSQALDAQAWYGGDVDRLWLKVDGDRRQGLGATRTEALWDRAITAFWDMQVGVRHDFGVGPGRTWGAFGVQGIAPYRFDVQATAYVGDGGRTALRVEAENDFRITQRWILQPDVKVDAFGRDDRSRRIGAGISSVVAGLRLRYDVTRRFGPYVGVVRLFRFGNTARMAREDRQVVERTEAVAGVRFWF